MVAGLIICNQIIINLLDVDPHIVLRTIATPPNQVFHKHAATTTTLPLIQKAVNIKPVLFCIHRGRS